MKKFLLLIGILGMTISCNRMVDDDVLSYSEDVFGVTFNQDWSTTISGSIKIYPESEDIEKVQVLVSDTFDSSLRILNETKINNNFVILNFDCPKKYSNLYVSFINRDGEHFYKKFNLGDLEIHYLDNATRGVVEVDNYITGVINDTTKTWANKRNWIPNEIFYIGNSNEILVKDYSSDFKNIFRDVIFNYFPNGKNVDNLSKIKKSGYYNESSYLITTGDKPVTISPVYKNDGGYHEISEAELYYYYFQGDLSVQEIEALPKYRAIDLSTVYTNEDNDSIKKNKTYTLIYYGDNIPNIGTTGTSKFPKDYKIGFVYKSNTTYEKPNKQGELYGDGRLNYNINNYGYFKSSKLGNTEPRMALMSVNKKTFLCIESGTDKDFNDLICEVEGVKQIIIIPDPEYNYYTFCFEDRRLGDYDLNDIVIKGARLDKTHVEWTLMACGANDELFIYGINGKYIKSDSEVHTIFGKTTKDFINTQKGNNVPYVKDTVVVEESFSFVANSPVVYDKTQDWEVQVSRAGEDPHAIMIPYNFRWPLEKIRVDRAYLRFNTWGENLIEEDDWYKFPVEGNIF